MVKKPKSVQKLTAPDKYDIKADAAIAKAEAIGPVRVSKSDKRKPRRASFPSTFARTP